LAGSPLILLDTGDALVGGGYLGDATRGEAVVDGMNLMRYDAMALGPLELSLGAEELRRRLQEARFPILSANVQDARSGDLFAEPYVILNVAGSTVGVLGLTRIPDQPTPGFTILDPLGAAEQILPEIAQKADTIVLLTNLSYRSALTLASDVPDIDLTVAALPSQLPTAPASARRTGTFVVTAEQPLVRHSGRRVGQLRLSVDGEGDLTVRDWESVPMGKEIPDDPEMRRLLDAYTSEITDD
jgi:2',3'-cyclic-nucleotide 2'-phosphodiesterase (5'-nucleotidase family)